MEVKAQLKSVRISARKIKLVIDLIRNKTVTDADKILQFTKKAGVLPISKLLKSAISNAVHNFKADKNNLFIKKITVGQGTSLKRWRPRAFGRAAPIRKHTCHIDIVLDEKETTTKKK